jgi:hypothetical protein
MTANETFVLMMALADGPLRYRDVYAAVRGERAWAILNSLHKAGALEHPAYNHWQITEKGRIAAALAMHKDAKLARSFGLKAA